MTRASKLLVSALVLGASACAGIGGDEFGISPYELVRARRVDVGNGNMSVVAPRPWNRRRPEMFEDIAAVEDWTLNGQLLDGITFVTGLRSGHFLVRQRKSADQQVPKFRADMTPPEIGEMLESLYRVRGGAVEFHTLSIQPRPFLGTNGFQFDYEHLDDDEVWRKGRAVGAVIGDQLYLVLLDATRSHYYEAALPDFEEIVASAQLRR